jgi:hypothetical protein
VGWAGLGWAGLGWGGLGWAGLFPTNTSIMGSISLALFIQKKSLHRKVGNDNQRGIPN